MINPKSPERLARGSRLDLPNADEHDSNRTIETRSERTDPTDRPQAPKWSLHHHIYIVDVHFSSRKEKENASLVGTTN